MNITEEDIFKFVFNPESLSKGKLEYLNANQNRFKKEIDYCKGLLAQTNITEIDSITEQIIQKIKSFKIVELYPQIIKPKEENGVKLAAASVLKEKKSNSLSFTDPNSKYLIRIVTTESQTLLYLFSEDKSKHDFQLTIHPSKTQYQIMDLSKPIEILYEEVIEKILIS
jgi:hypothetical protein